MTEYRCKDCGYVQDFEPTEMLMLKHFNVTDTGCPSCHKCNEWTEEDSPTTNS